MDAFPVAGLQQSRPAVVKDHIRFSGIPSADFDILPAKLRADSGAKGLTDCLFCGEASGQMEEMLERAATNQEREMDTLIATLLAVMEPMLILLMGAIVLTIVIAILLPIFQINTLIK